MALYHLAKMQVGIKAARNVSTTYLFKIAYAASYYVKRFFIGSTFIYPIKFILKILFCLNDLLKWELNCLRYMVLYAFQ